MALSDRSTLTQDEVEARIDELSEDSSVEVYRTKNDEVIETFSSETEAEAFIDDNDYDTDRVMTRSGLGDDDREELKNLRAFNDECGRDVPGWRSGTVVYNENDTSDDAVRGLLQSEYGAGGRIDFDEFPFSLIDLSEAFNSLLSNAGSSYGTLDGVSFYALG